MDDIERQELRLDNALADSKPPGKRKLILHEDFVEYICRNHSDAARFLQDIPSE